MESLKIITRQASLRVAEYAFHYAKSHGRERVSAIHKANIMQKTDGLFLKVHHCTCLYKIFGLKFYSRILLLTAFHLNYFSVAVRLQRNILR